MIAWAGSNSAHSVASQPGHGPDPKITHKTAPARFRTRSVGSLILFILIIPFTATFNQPGVRMDEGSVLVYPELINHGLLRYPDFETFYGAAKVYLLAGAYCLFGTDTTVQRCVDFVYRVLILARVFPEA